MCWTSSDLIIEIAAYVEGVSPSMAAHSTVAATERPRWQEDCASIRGRRVPKRQKAVKIETIEGLHGPRFLDPAGDRPEPDHVESGCPEVQKTEIAEARTQTPVAHRRLGIDALVLRQPSDRGLLGSDLVDELQPEGLPAGEDAAVRNVVERFTLDMAPALHQPAKPGIGIHDDRFDRRARLGARGLESVGGSLERRGLDLLDLHSEGF